MRTEKIPLGPKFTTVAKNDWISNLRCTMSFENSQIKEENNFFQNVNLIIFI